MKRAGIISLLIFQIFICYGSLLFIYMISAILDNTEADLISEVGLLVIQPIIGSIIIAVTICICFVIGLPIRLNSRLNRWWTGKPLVPLMGIAVGILFFIVAYSSGFIEQREITQDGGPYLKQLPNYNLSLIGWFTIAFSLLHFYPLRVFQFFGRLATRILLAKSK